MRHVWTTLVLIVLFPVLPAMSGFSAGNVLVRADLFGSVADPRGAVVVDASVTLSALDREAALVTATDQQGHYEFRDVLPGNYRLWARKLGFASVGATLTVIAGETNHADLQFLQLVTQIQQVSVVDSEPAALTPDPSERILVHDEVLEANPGRPGAPISIPGLPIETASGGIKAPQYFAPGVAGDHGEPIAQYFQIGDFLFPNNLLCLSKTSKCLNGVDTFFHNPPRCSFLSRHFSPL